MGYYSNFYGYARITNNDNEEEGFNIKNFKTALETISTYDLDTDIDEEPEIDEETNFEIVDVKWSNYKEDLINLSLLFPNVEIFVTRYGENNTDVEETYLRNGYIETRIAEFILPQWENEEIDDIFEQNRLYD